MIGLDTEGSDGCTLFQISTNANIYIFDGVILKNDKIFL